MKKYFAIILIIIGFAFLSSGKDAPLSSEDATRNSGSMKAITGPADREVQQKSNVPETVYVNPSKTQQLFENQYHVYDFFLKLAIGVFSFFLTVLAFLVAFAGYWIYKDRKQMSDDIKDAKADMEKARTTINTECANLLEARKELDGSTANAIEKGNALKTLVEDAKAKIEQLDGHLRKAEKSSQDAAALKLQVEQASISVQGRLAELSKTMKIPSVPGPEREATQLFNEAVDDYENGKIEDVVTKLAKAIMLKPDFADAYNNLGVTLGKQGKIDEEVAAYRKAIKLKPDLAETHFNLGVAFGNQGKFDEGVAAYLEAIRVKPDYADAHYNLGMALFRQGKWDDAGVAFREAIQVNPENGKAYVNLGVTLAKQENLDEAILAYHDAIRFEPNFALAYYNLACALALKDEKNDAIKRLSDAVEKGFDNWPLMEKDEELNNLRNDPKFKELATAVKKRWEEKGSLS